METSDEVFAVQDATARLRRRRLWLLGGVLGALVLAALAVVVYSDAEPPDLSDLAFEPVAVADADNAYLALVALGTELKAKPVIREDEVDDAPVVVAAGEAGVAATEVVEPETGLFGAGGGSYEAKKTLRERLLDGEAWTPERIAKWEADLDAVAARVREIAKMPLAQGARPQTYRDALPAGELRTLFQHAKLAVWAQYHTGRDDEAVATLRAAWRCGVMLRDGRGPLLEYLVGLVGMGIVEATMWDLAGRPELGSAPIRDMLDALAQMPAGEDGFAHAIRVEANLMFAELAKHDGKDAEAMTFTDSRMVRVLAKTRVLFPLVYKPNLTVGEYADRVRWRLSNLSLSMAELQAHSSAHVGCPQCDGVDSENWWRPYNLHGRTLIAMIDPAQGGLMKSRLKNFSRTSLLRTYLALRLWHLERGALPERLDELVPEYLPAVPVDYVDGAPIRYSRELGVVWSAGEKNLVISAADQEIAKGEMVYWLTFAAAGAVEMEASENKMPSPSETGEGASAEAMTVE